ncbi:P-loop containing nucleoside triphosphate hydrolase protein [Gigaspora margarita]|uniref:P-loop containing nucleoside triphosphate hydrolase protein n=3 Tax=Gigaspora margarita TaxID=4874 RepID=A0A8H4A7Y7_GIGMA|nr:P-loop containing nucleoside triphosphate hydrolase protein [Gigaspora margarita]
MQTIINVVSIVDDLQSHYTRTPKPCIWLPRTWCLKNNIHPNQVLFLRSYNQCQSSDQNCSKIFASVKLYSKYSVLFRDKPSFPDKLDFQLPNVSSNSDISHELDKSDSQAVISKLLACNLGICSLFDRVDNLEFSIRLNLIEVVNNIPIATRVILFSLTKHFANVHDDNLVNNKIDESLIKRVHLGSIVSTNTWICYQGCNGMQFLKVLQIYINDDNIKSPVLATKNAIVSSIEPVDHISKISESTNIEITNDSNVLFVRCQIDGLQKIYQPVFYLPKFYDRSQWLERIVRQIGGLNNVISEIIEQIHTFIVTALRGKFRRGIKRSKGILLTGRPGTGKTSLALCIAETSGLPYVAINCPDMFKTDEGAAEKEICLIFESMLRHRVSIVILDEIDIISDTSTSDRAGIEAKLFSIIVKLIDSINENDWENPCKGQIFIIGTTNRHHAINSHLYRPGRLDRIYELVIKKSEQRLGLLKIMSEKLPFIEEQKDLILQKVSRMTHGFVATDLQYLCTQVAIQLVREGNKNIDGDSCEDLDNPYVHVKFQHFEEALKVVKPSNLNEFQTKIPDIRFSDIFGIDEIIEDLKLTVIEPFHNPQEFIKFGISPPRGILVYGPPGVGKTILSCAIAAETGINFIFVESSHIRSKIVGESENNISRMFAQAKANSPCVLFIDQIEILASVRGISATSENTEDRIVTSFLTEMDGIFTSRNREGPEVEVLVITATNRPEIIDPALLRPGRLDQHIYIPPPNYEQRISILKGKFQKMLTNITNDQLSYLAQDTDGFSGADLDNLCREAALISIRENIDNEKITYDHFVQAKSLCKASLLDYQPVFISSKSVEIKDG